MVTRRDLFYLYCLEKGHQCNLAYGLATYFDSMSSKSCGALYGGYYITRLVARLDVLSIGLTRSYLILALDMDALRSMRVVEKRRDRYVLIIGAALEAIADDMPVDPPISEVPIPDVQMPYVLEDR